MKPPGSLLACVCLIIQTGLHAAFGAPHSPMQATAGDLELFARIKDQRRRTYCAMAHRLDQNVGKIVGAIRKEGISS